MKKRMIALMMAAVLGASLAACGGKTADTSAAQQAQEEAAEPAEEAPAEEEKEEPAADAAEAPAAETPAGEATEPAEAEQEAAAAETADGALRLFVLSGPTGIGAMNLWAAADAGETAQAYNITMTGANDEIVAALSKGEILAPAGVSGEEIASVADLKGRTIYAPGQGANPEYVLRYVLSGNGVDPDADVTIQFVGEGSELLSVWQNDPEALIMAPQPVATALLMQNEGASKLFDMTDEWDAVSGGASRLMQGCVVVRKAFLEENPEAVETFLTEYQASIEKAQSDVEGTAALCESYGLIPKAAIAQKAIPQCGLTFVSGEEMKEQLGGYLQVMFDAAPASVGGALPADDFYY